MIKPARDYVLAQLPPKESRTVSGIYIPEKAQEQKATFTGIVLGVGEDVEEVEVNDQVIYKSYSTYDITIEKEEYILIHQDDIIAKLEETNESKLSTKKSA